MATVGTTSDQMPVDMNASKFNHAYMTFQGVTQEMNQFQNGQALTGQQNNTPETLQEDYGGGAHFYDSNAKSGQITLNFIDNSYWDTILGNIYHIEHDNLTPESVKNSFVHVTYKNDLTGKSMVGEYGRITKMPNQTMNNTVSDVAWVISFAKYDVDWGNSNAFSSN
ncbi:hypothetical protein DY120_07460 [Apilactobacillus micheneri]|uniref:Uncharacterized protein n=1 Tax=Apilactobacillus micheneri TaxID=1899430 RepID=A0ABY2YZQ8_9LACO|nr:hypothetical protein [Apilactobacillus micheneri]TPR23135.1 hypothetical protein DY114_07445 [Apilactobacillus micheneri]TPR24453.1 hypothetical protein DY111_07460 [Apilactobacillus micheneri]TPR29400.1 hypothetical protein DY120_07460 [Apilactobacillus micheneri]TPR34607.1 hypothetical protein DY027_07450 [Apilactobacillus micheneri]